MLNKNITNSILAAILLVFLGGLSPAFAAAVLEIKPITWDIIGLDSNNVNAGSNTFPVGARVCNTGDAIATNVTATFVFDSANANINISGSNTLTLASLPFGVGFKDIGNTGATPANCTDFYWNAIVNRVAAAYDTARAYHITATADTLGTVSTPANRQLYVEHLVSQNRNSVTSIVGPTTVFVGQTYEYTVNAATATQGYEQLAAFANFPNIIFRILAVSANYNVPTGATNNATYADACGWDPVTTSGTYRSCIGPNNYGSGKAGGNPISVTYTVLVLSAGTADVSSLIYDFSGSSFHYNSDFGGSPNLIAITAVDPTADLAITKSDSPDPVVVGNTLTYTLNVTNNGPDPASNVTVTDTLPSGVTFQSASGTGWTCTGNSSTVTCTQASLATGAAPAITITVTAPNVPNGTILTNNASVSSTTVDSVSGNNSTSTTTTVAASADLSVTKSLHGNHIS